MEDTEVLTQEFLKRVIHYDPLTGVFTWLERSISMFDHYKYPEKMCIFWNIRYSGVTAGHKSKEGNNFYNYIGFSLNRKKKKYPGHRLAFLYMTGSFPENCVDHIDGNGMNNTWSNIRDTTLQENQRNRTINKNNTSGYTGVHWNKRNKNWFTVICINGKNIYGGHFTDKNDAISRRKELEIEYGFHENHGRKQ